MSFSPASTASTEKHNSTVKAVHVGHDIAEDYLQSGYELDAQTDKRLRWKADLHICLFVCFIYALQFVDKVSNGLGAVMGLQTDLNMQGSMYSWVGSSFYLAYLIFEVPVTTVLQKFPLAKTTAVMLTAWGAVLACSGASQNYAGYITTRVILGILECGITPAFVVITAQWYRREEQYARTCLWFGFCGFGAMILDLIAYGLVVRDEHGTLPIAGWRLLFIILGVITIAFGILFWFHIPDNPSKAWFLTPEERALQVLRIRVNKQGYGSRTFKWYQVRETLLDYNTWLNFTFALFSSLPNGGLTNFGVLVLQGLGFESTRASILIDIPSGGVMMVGSILTAVVAAFWLSARRWTHALFGSALNVMCMFLLAWGPNNASRISGYFLWGWLSLIPYVAVISWVGSNSAGHTKKLLSSGITMIGYCVGNLIGPQVFKKSEYPHYGTAKAVMAASSIVCLAVQVAYVLLNFWENKRRDKANVKLPADITNPEFADLTDRENPEFRYAL